MDHFKSLNLLHYVFVFQPQGMWDLDPQSGIKPAPLALEGEILTTGPPGKSYMTLFLKCIRPSLIAKGMQTFWTTMKNRLKLRK